MNTWRIGCFSQSHCHHLSGGDSYPYQSAEDENPSDSFKSLHLHVVIIYSWPESDDYNLRQNLKFGFRFLAPLCWSPNVKHEARLTGSALSMQDWGCISAESFEVGAGQPLLSMRLFGLFESYFRSSCAPRKR